MAYSPNAQNIISDIEFELAQGMVAQEDIGEAVEAVKQFQNSARVKTFQTLKATDHYRESFNRLFQVTDMLTALLQEFALNLGSIKLQVDKLRGNPPRMLRSRGETTDSKLKTTIEQSADIFSLSPVWNDCNEYRKFCRLS